MKRFLARGAAIAAFTLQALTAHAAALPGPLVDSQWLADHLADVQVVDVRGNAKSWTAAPEVETDAKTGKRKLVEVGGHIAGARLLEMGKLRGERQIAGQRLAIVAEQEVLDDKVADLLLHSIRHAPGPHPVSVRRGCWLAAKVRCHSCVERTPMKAVLSLKLVALPLSALHFSFSTILQLNKPASTSALSESAASTTGLAAGTENVWLSGAR